MAVKSINYSNLIGNFTNSQSLAERSVQQYSHNLKLFIRYLGNKKLTRTNVANYIKKLQQDGLNGKTIVNRLVTIKRFAKWLWEEDKITQKEYKKIYGYKVKLDLGESNRRVLTPEEEEKGYKRLANPLLKMMFWTGLRYGLRRSEYINLKIDDVDLDKRIVIIRKSKGNKTRRIGILKTHVPIWQQWFKTREAYQVDHDHIFFTDRGKAGTRSFDRYFNKLSEQVLGNKEITSHTLRYTYAVKCWRSGMDLVVLSKMLGHANLTTTQIYLRIDEEEILEKYKEQASRVL
ncbi:MAG: tyrosine-type recombinase/integrase [Candidatus Hodarchaeales archaeon]|jgi:integrase/recombinase XerD